MVDYSRWNRIEISDDEDDTHPNIDTGSLFRWRHQARLERMEKQRLEKQELEQKQMELNEKLSKINLSDSKDNDGDENNKEEREKLLKEKQLLQEKFEEMKRKEKLQPWNVDTISHDSWSKTLVNRNCLSKESNDLIDENDDLENLSDEHINRYENFIKKYESKIREFAFYSRFEDFRMYLLNNPQLACQSTLDYMMLWCLQLKIDQKNSLLEHVSRQAVIIQMILDLAKTVRSDPRDCLTTFFTKSKKNWKKFQQFWQDELNEFKERLQKAADMRIERAVQEQIESNEKLIGPGGLDAQEVFDSLPKNLQECFEKRDNKLLEKVLAEMDPEQAEYHMQRCVDAGLWDLNRNMAEDEDEILLKEINKKESNMNDGREGIWEQFKEDASDEEEN